jgi:hypothetical protein
MVKEVNVATPEKYVEIPLEMYEEMLALLPGDRANEVEDRARVFTKVTVRTQTRRVFSPPEERETFGQDVYKPGKGSNRKGGSLGRFG